MRTFCPMKYLPENSYAIITKDGNGDALRTVQTIWFRAYRQMVKLKKQKNKNRSKREE